MTVKELLKNFHFHNGLKCGIRMIYDNGYLNTDSIDFIIEEDGSKQVINWTIDKWRDKIRLNIVV